MQAEFLYRLFLVCIDRMIYITYRTSSAIALCMDYEIECQVGEDVRPPKIQIQIEQSLGTDLNIIQTITSIANRLFYRKGFGM